MKKVFIILLTLLLFTIVAACQRVYHVVFDANGVNPTSFPSSYFVSKNSKIIPPDTPLSQTHQFIRWCDQDTQIVWNFDDLVSKNITLVAQWNKLDKINFLSGTNLVDTNYLAWQGRNLYKDDSVNFYNTGSGFEITFYGTELLAVLTSSNVTNKNNCATFGVSVDGVDFSLTPNLILNKLTSKVIIASNLELGKHTVKVYKRSEASDSSNSLISIETDGYFLESSTNKKLNFSFIGASGISGNGNLGKNGELRTTLNSSSLHSFSYLTARMYDANFEIIANSGWGLEYGYNTTNSQGINLLKAYESYGILQNESLVPVTYQHHFVPDIVVVNAGGNDFTSHINGLTGSAKEIAINTFKTSVISLLKRILTINSKCQIIWTHTSDSINGLHAKNVIDTLPLTLRRNIGMLVIPRPGDNGNQIGVGNHANVSTHIEISNLIVAEITKLGYNPLHGNIDF